MFENYFAAFDLTASDATRIDCTGTISCNYLIHVATSMPKRPIVVSYSIIPGDGLKEGIDYELASKNKTIEFYPGTFDKSIRIQWLPNPIDKSKDNTLTIKLESNNAGLCLGLPGPAETNRSITITKY